MSVFIGFASGAVCVFGRVWANMLGQERKLARPWNHVALFLIGGYLGYYSDEWEAQALNALNEERALRNMPIIKREEINLNSQMAKKDEWFAKANDYVKKTINADDENDAKQ